MPCYVALFRGINVGKAKRIAMADLKALLGELGFANARTLLNSGNAVFSGKAEPTTRIADRIRTAVREELKVDSFVIVKTGQDVAAIIAGNELARVCADDSRLLITVARSPQALATPPGGAPPGWGGGG